LGPLIPKIQGISCYISGKWDKWGLIKCPGKLNQDGKIITIKISCIFQDKSSISYGAFIRLYFTNGCPYTSKIFFTGEESPHAN